MILTNARLGEITSSVSDTYETLIEELVEGIRERDKLLEEMSLQLSEVIVIVQGMKRKINEES